MTTTDNQPLSVTLPLAGTVLVPELDPGLAVLRDAARSAQATGIHPVPTLSAIDARAWEGRPAEEDWLMWRARRTATRLQEIPFVFTQGERVAGRPDLRPPTAKEQAENGRAQVTLEEIPAFPGGDSGHFHPDFRMLFRTGISGLVSEIHQRRRGAPDEEAICLYDACEVALGGLSRFCARVSRRCLEMANDHPEAPDDWLELSGICDRISEAPPETFHEAVQLMWLTMVGLWFGEDHYLTTPGRMDQTLWPFYEADLAAGRLTPHDALQLINNLYINCNTILGAGSALSVMVGGRDRSGTDVTNDLTYLCLLARQSTHLVYPTVGLAWHEGSPLELTDHCCRMIATGIGDPAFFNDELIVSGLRSNGVTPGDAFDYMNSTCVEIKPVGTSNIWVTAPYFNCPKAVLEVMSEVADGHIGPPETFEEFQLLVEERLADTVANAALGLDDQWQRRSEAGCFPLASCLIHDCLESGRDFDRGGARYNWVENSFVGLANLVDGLAAIRHLVYETGSYTIAQLHAILAANFQNAESLRQQILNRLPSYGNDDDAVDALAERWAAFLQTTTAANRVGPHRYVPGFFCWIVHERFGRETGATPDGRKAGYPLADGAGAAQGREREGPTASALSTTKWSHQEAIGGLVHNVRFSGNALRTERDLAALRDLVFTYLRRGGFEIQVNVVGTEQLREAQAHPEDHPDLLVRVAGYSDYFVNLNTNMQEEVIARTEHESI